MIKNHKEFNDKIKKSNTHKSIIQSMGGRSSLIHNIIPPYDVVKYVSKRESTYDKILSKIYKNLYNKDLIYDNENDCIIIKNSKGIFFVDTESLINDIKIINPINIILHLDSSNIEPNIMCFIGQIPYQNSSSFLYKTLDKKSIEELGNMTVNYDLSEKLSMQELEKGVKYFRQPKNFFINDTNVVSHVKSTTTFSFLSLSRYEILFDSRFYIDNITTNIDLDFSDMPLKCDIKNLKFNYIKDVYEHCELQVAINQTIHIHNLDLTDINYNVDIYESINKGYNAKLHIDTIKGDISKLHIDPKVDAVIGEKKIPYEKWYKKNQPNLCKGKTFYLSGKYNLSQDVLKGYIEDLGGTLTKDLLHADYLVIEQNRESISLYNDCFYEKLRLNTIYAKQISFLHNIFYR